jgi:hypothetical protein
MFKVLILIALIACVALAAKKEDKLIRFDLKKIPDREFVAGILARAAKGIKPSYKLKGSGSIVINDYENSQYYGEISLGMLIFYLYSLLFIYSLLYSIIRNSWTII